jgi:hypothetical protein
MQDSAVRNTSPVREICGVGSVESALGTAARNYRLEDFHEGRRRNYLGGMAAFMRKER